MNNTEQIQFHTRESFQEGSRFFAAESKDFKAYAPAFFEGAKNIRCGQKFYGDTWSIQVLLPGMFPAGRGSLDRFWSMEVLEGVVPKGSQNLTVRSSGYTLGWITLSDKGYIGQRHDESGPLIAQEFQKAVPVSRIFSTLLPDNPELLRKTLLEFTLSYQLDVVITTGGTGVGPRDYTPEVTAALLEKRLPGFEQAMMLSALQKTPYAMISRAVAGLSGKSLVVNLPGSPRAVQENITPLLPAFQHTLEKIHGDMSDCAIS